MPQINAASQSPVLHTPANEGALHVPTQASPSPLNIPNQSQAGTETGTVHPHLEVHMAPSPLGNLGVWIGLFSIVLGLVLAKSYRRVTRQNEMIDKINAKNEMLRSERPR